MKKIISLIFAVCLVMALGVLCFAETFTGEIGSGEALAEAISTHECDVELYLTDDIELEETVVIPAGRNVKIDFCDCSINMTGEGTAFKIEANATLEITNEFLYMSNLNAASGAAIENFGTVIQERIGVFSEDSYAVKNHGSYFLNGGHIDNGADCAIVWNSGSFEINGGSILRIEGDNRVLFETDNETYHDAQIYITGGDTIGNFSDNELNIIIDGFCNFRTPDDETNPNIWHLFDQCEAYIYFYHWECGGVTKLFSSLQDALDNAVEDYQDNVHILHELDGTYYINGEIFGLFVEGYDPDNDTPDIRPGNNLVLEKDVVEYEYGGKYVYLDVYNPESTVFYYSVDEYGVERSITEFPDYQIGSDVTLEKQIFIKDGYIFLGWATDPEAKEAEYQPGDKYYLREKNELYAVWRKIGDNDVTFRVDSVVGREGEEVIVDVKLNKNPNIGAISMSINYDHNMLQLVGYQDAGLTGWVVGTYQGEGASWYNANGSDATDTVLRLKFKVIGNDEWFVPITLSEIDVVDVSENPVMAGVFSGGVEVKNFLYGDINSDGKISAVDLLRLAKYLAKCDVEIDFIAADVTLDGKVSAADLLRLAKYYVGLDVELGRDKRESGITVQIGPNPETLDPALNSAVDGGNMLITLFEPLLIIDEDGNCVPGQAESYTVSDDGLTWVFTMRDGLKWSDGSPLDAKDFEYTFKRVADPELESPYAFTVLYMIDGYDEVIETGDTDYLNVKASDDGKTLTVKLIYPCAYFDQVVAFATLSPVKKDVVEAYGNDWAYYPETYVCNGPYTMSEWVPGEGIICKKNENYVGGWDADRIVTDQITFLLLEDSAAVYAAYQSGEALMIRDIPTEEIPSLTRAEDGGDFYVDTILGTYYVSMNIDKAPFDDPLVRKALSLAIDREYVANVVMEGTYAPAYNFVGPGFMGAEGSFFDEAVKRNGGTYISENYEANVEAAKQALADAGYPNGEGLPVITYSTNDANYHVAVAEYLQEAFAELGITMVIEKADWASFTPQCRAGEYEIARNGWVCDYNDPSNLIELLYSTNGNNDGKYNNPDFDAAIDASRTADSAAHFQALHDAERIMMEDYACIPIAYYNDFWLQDPSLKGIWHSPYGYWYFQYAYLDK